MTDTKPYLQIKGLAKKYGDNLAVKPLELDIYQHEIFALLGSSGSGKTTLAESMLYGSGLIKRRGTVEAKNTVSDYFPVEQEYGYSVFPTVFHVEWNNKKLNIIDCPGADDFVGGAITALNVTDQAVILINGQYGPEVGTQNAFRYTEKLKKPVIFLVNQLDSEKCDYDSIITTMQDNQKTFAVVGADGKIRPHFIAIANLESRDEATVRKGNEKVIRPRFADAEFFWQQDLKHKLADYLPRLEHVVYQEKLGSVAAKTRRLEALGRALAPVCGADADNVATAAHISKSDLLTEMVMEFPELQGLMGRYYAAAEGYAADIAAALDEQYQPRGAGGALPQTRTGLALAIAEKLDTLVGGFAIGAKPTGSKDPYALRRMAISLIRLITENELALPLAAWLDKSAAQYDAALGAPIHVAAVREYILERLDSHYREQGIRSETCQAVLALGSDDLVDIERRIRALDTFAGSPSATSLLASAKRIRNILKKNGERNEAVAADRLIEPAEQALWQNWQTLAPAIDAELQKSDYRAALEQLATLGAPLDAFFTDVMVMSDDPALQQNRLALLTTLQRGFDQIADLSLLSE